MLHLLEDYGIELDTWVDISDIVMGGTKIKRRAQVYYMKYCQMERRVELLVQKYFYAVNEDGSYGESMAAVDGVQTTSTLVVAKNEYLIDMNAQQVVGTVDLLGTDAGGNGRYPSAFAQGAALWDAKNNKELEVMRDYDFWKLMAATTPVVLDSMIYDQAVAASQRGLL